MSSKLNKLFILISLISSSSFASSIGEYTSDAVITTKVKAAIVAERALSALDVAAETNNGVVTLTGIVATAAQADYSARVSRDVEGVKQVENKLKVDPSRSK